jgi:hypothetical protein
MKIGAIRIPATIPLSQQGVNRLVARERLWHDDSSGRPAPTIMITPFQVGSSARSIKEPLHCVEV